MKAKKRPVRALYEVESKEEPRHTGLPEAIDAFNAKVIRSDWIDQLIVEAAAVDAPPPAVVLADEVRMWGTYLRFTPDDILAAFELGRAVERLNVQLNPKSQFVFAKIDEDTARAKGFARARVEKAAQSPPIDLREVARFIKKLKVEPRHWAAQVAKKFGVSPRHARRLIKRTLSK